MHRRYYGNDLVLGTTGDGSEVTWTETQRRTHMYVSGVTRSGKSRFVQSLVQQDVAQHWKHRQGLLLLDPHGELYDGVLAYIADNPALWRLPVILIDLRKDDWIIAYNLLKERPGIDPAVVATSFIEAVTHAFGGANPTETPRLARIARLFVQALFDTKRTLFDVLPLLEHSNSALRDALLRELPQSSARSHLEQLNQLNKREFDTSVESFTNRISPMLSNRVIGSMVGQSSAPSFDFDRAIEDGAIVLVNLAIERGKIAESDSKLFASLMLSDLWQVAKLRGKKASGYAKPFAVYADEFQNFLTYTMSQQLDQASGFGLQFILANQFPQQILDNGGEFGRAIYNSVMVNTLTKVAFASARQHDLRASLVAEIFDGAIDVHRVEPSITSFQTVGHEECILRGGGTTTGRTTSKGLTAGTADAEGETVAHGTQDGEGAGTTETSSTGSNWSAGHVSSMGHVDTTALGTSTPELGLDVTIPVTSIETSISGDSVGVADSENEGGNSSESIATSANSFHVKSRSTAKQRVKTNTAAETLSTSESFSESSSWQTTLKPILEERPTQLMSVENQLFELGQRLAAQPPQHAHARLPGKRLPKAFRALDCPDATVSHYVVERRRMRFISSMRCALSIDDAIARISDTRAPRTPDIDDQLRIAAAGRRRPRGTVKERGNE